MCLKSRATDHSTRRWVATSLCTSLIQPECSGPDPEMGMALYRTFQEAALAAPRMHLDVLLETGPAAVREIHDILRSLLPRIARSGPKLGPLGDLDTLPARLETELAASKGPATWLGLVGAWARRPINQASN